MKHSGNGRKIESIDFLSVNNNFKYFSSALSLRMFNTPGHITESMPLATKIVPVMSSLAAVSVTTVVKGFIRSIDCHSHGKLILGLECNSFSRRRGILKGLDKITTNSRPEFLDYVHVASTHTESSQKRKMVVGLSR